MFGKYPIQKKGIDDVEYGCSTRHVISLQVEVSSVGMLLEYHYAMVVVTVLSRRTLASSVVQENMLLDSSIDLYHQMLGKRLQSL